MNKKHFYDRIFAIFIAFLIIITGSNSVTLVSLAEAIETTAEDEKNQEVDEKPKGGFLDDPSMIEKDPEQTDRSRIFPLWKSIAKGRALPRPFSVGLVTYYQIQDYNIASASIEIEPFPPRELNVSNTFANISSKSAGIKGGLWLFPFLNLHAAVGYSETDSDIFLRDVPVGVIPGPGGPTTILGEKLLELKFDGPYWNVGMTTVGGWNRWFGSLTLSYGKATLDASVGAIGTNTFTAERVMPKFGYAFKGTSVWLGAVWMSEESHQIGTIDGFKYDVLIERTDWTPLVGINTILGMNWEMTVEGGFGDRVSAMFSLGYRF